MLMCYLNDNFNGGVYFQNINDCLYYSERLSNQKIEVPIKVENYKCMCKLIPNIDPKKVKVYQEVAMLQALIGPVTGLLDKFIPDADKKADLTHKIATMSERHAQELALAQIEVLKEDAKGNWFQSSWRPLIGWISGLSLGINYMVAPICAGFGINIPQADMSVMMPLMFGMLGIGGMRSFDKMKKTDTKN